jgi:hypothetical protein
MVVWSVHSTGPRLVQAPPSNCPVLMVRSATVCRSGASTTLGRIVPAASLWGRETCDGLQDLSRISDMILREIGWSCASRPYRRLWKNLSMSRTRGHTGLVPPAASAETRRVLKASHNPEAFQQCLSDNPARGYRRIKGGRHAGSIQIRSHLPVR